MNKPRVGLVGLGLAVKPHALALRDLADRVEVAGGFSPSPERRAAFAREYGLPTVESLDTLLADPTVSALIILTPPRTHADLARQAAAAGKHVLLEKPVDVDYPQARAVVDAVAAHGVQLGVVFQFRFRPGALALRKLLDEGALGQVLSINAAVRWWRSSAYYAEPGRGMRARDGGGVLLTQAIHTLDLLLSLVGPARRVSALCRTSALRSMDTEDIACATVEFANGAVGVIDATTAAYPGYPERIEIAGTLGSAVLTAERLTVHRHEHEPLEIGGSLAGGGGADPMAFSHIPHRMLIEDFLDAVVAQRAPSVSGRSALAVHGLIDAMLASSAQGRWVDLPAL